jgi:hypothetical protein
MSNVRTSAGSTLGISATLPTAFTDDAVNGYPALSFINIGEITDMGEFGKEFALVTHNPLGERGTIKRKGSFNNGSITLQLGLDNSDAGQGALQTALESDDSVALEVELQDGTIYYFTAQVMSFMINVGSVDQITSASVMLEIDRDIVEVAPSS